VPWSREGDVFLIHRPARTASNSVSKRSAWAWENTSGGRIFSTLERHPVDETNTCRSRNPFTAAAVAAADLGTLEPGRRADLVILEADPLADARNYRRIAAVMKDGDLVDRAALPQNPMLTAGTPSAADTGG
jgi:hypothetical protein